MIITPGTLVPARFVDGHPAQHSGDTHVSANDLLVIDTVTGETLKLVKSVDTDTMKAMRYELSVGDPVDSPMEPELVEHPNPVRLEAR